MGAVDSSSVTAWTGKTGEVINRGIINAPRGNITMAGRDVMQQSVLTATTSVSFNGRIDLQASYGAVANPIYDPTNAAFGAPFLFTNSGKVTLWANSVTSSYPGLRVAGLVDTRRDYGRVATVTPIRGRSHSPGRHHH